MGRQAASAPLNAQCSREGVEGFGGLRSAQREQQKVLVRFLRAPLIAPVSFCENLAELPGRAKPVRIGSLGHKEESIDRDGGWGNEGATK
jgi:hypothetical protein